MKLNKTYIVILIILEWMLSVSFCLGQVTDNKSEVKEQEEVIHQNDMPGLTNFAKVSDTLYRGAQPTAQGFEELKKMGIKTIVNLRGYHSDRKLLKGLGFRYVYISFKTWHAEDEDVIRFLKVVTNSDYWPIFVHCKHGSDRTGMMVAIYRIYVHGWTVENAMKELPTYGFHKIWKNLKKYLLNLNIEEIKKNMEITENPEIEIIK